ncbi:MAG TPA: cysteine hydrolase [Anaerolineae bacterium]|nr:cysteine hydrolase [Anaerolineae bacterium]
MQRSFMDPEASLNVPTSWEILPVILKLVNFCREVKIPIVFTQFVADPGKVNHLVIDPFGPECLPPIPGKPTGWGYPSGNSNLDIKGPENPDIIEELSPHPEDIIIHGYTYDKFYQTNLDMTLRGLGINYLIFTGMMADICLGDTLKSAFNRNYRITAVRDAITTIWEDVLAIMFDIWERKYARIAESDAVIAEIQAQQS